MNIHSFGIFRYRLPLAQPLQLKGKSLSYRDGLLFCLTDVHGHLGWGEVAPLAGFSRESLEEAVDQCCYLRDHLSRTDLPDRLELLDGGFDRWLGPMVLAPSVRFGLESAILNLIARERKTSVAQLLTSECRSVVSVNALLAGEKEQMLDATDRFLVDGYTAFKLKIGGHSIDTAIELAELVREKIGDQCLLRLDANRSFDIKQSYYIMDALAGLNIDYFEEPAANFEQVRMLMRVSGLPVPIALDESLLEIDPMDLLSYPLIKAVVIKPTLLGLDRAVQFARVAGSRGIQAVFSSSFESGVGISMIANLAAAICPQDIPAGIGTLDRFHRHLTVDQLKIQDGRIDPVEYGRIGQSINTDLLEMI